MRFGVTLNNWTNLLPGFVPFLTCVRGLCVGPVCGLCLVTLLPAVLCVVWAERGNPQKMCKVHFQVRQKGTCSSVEQFCSKINKTFLFQLSRLLLKNKKKLPEGWLYLFWRKLLYHAGDKGLTYNLLLHGTKPKMELSCLLLITSQLVGITTK